MATDVNLKHTTWERRDPPFRTAGVWRHDHYLREVEVGPDVLDRRRLRVELEHNTTERSAGRSRETVLTLHGKTRVSYVVRSDTRGTYLSTGTSKKPWICDACKSIVCDNRCQPPRPCLAHHRYARRTYVLGDGGGGEVGSALTMTWSHPDF